MPDISKTQIDISSTLKEIVFGAEDGMVSTLGAVSGIAVGSQDKHLIILSGIVIIAVESISMAIGSYLSNSTTKEVDAKAITGELQDMVRFPDKERQELLQYFIRDGWNKQMAYKMAKVASLNHQLMLREHEYRELGIFPYHRNQPLKNAYSMFISYVGGGLIPLCSYFLLPLSQATVISFIVTLIGLFILGIVTTHYTSVSPWKAGMRTMILGTLAFMVGSLIGKLSLYL